MELRMSTNESREEAIHFLLSVQTDKTFASIFGASHRMSADEANRRLEFNQNAERLTALKAELQALSDEEIHKRAAAMRALLQKKRDQEEAKFHFNQGKAIADVEYWSSYPSWTLEEGVALLLDRDPRHVRWEVMKSYVNVSTVAKRFDDLFTLVVRCKHTGVLNASNFPGEFLRWAQRTNIEPPERLLAAVQAKGIVVVDWQDVYQQSRQEAELQKARVLELEKENERISAERDQLLARMAANAGPWPWGERQTVLLRHLAAAAEKFWTLYDPDDHSTAPTNDEVADWLIKRGVASRVARVMAQVLRDDRVPAGRR